MGEMLAYFDETDDHSLFNRLSRENVEKLRRKNLSKFTIPKQRNDTVAFVNVLNVLVSHGIYDRKTLQHQRINKFHE